MLATEAWQVGIEAGALGVDADLARIALEFRVSPDHLVEIEPKPKRPRTPAPDADADQVELMDRLAVCAGFAGLGHFLDAQMSAAPGQLAPATLAMLRRVRDRGHFKAHEARRLVRVLKKLDGRQRPLPGP